MYAVAAPREYNTNSETITSVPGGSPAARSGPVGVIRGSVILSSRRTLMLTIAQAFDVAVQHHQAGRLPQAEQL